MFSASFSSHYKNLPFVCGQIKIIYHECRVGIGKSVHRTNGVPVGQIFLFKCSSKAEMILRLAQTAKSPFICH